MKYVYLLATYEEHGAEDVIATLDRSKVVDLAIEKWPYLKEVNDRRSWDDREWRTDHTYLSHLLTKSDEELCTGIGHDLGFGWGGVQFYVVELKE